MLNKPSIEAVLAGGIGSRFLRPLHGSYCFSRIPGTLETALTGSSPMPVLPADVMGNLGLRHPRVVFLFIDSFGWRFLTRYEDELSLVQRAAKEGVVSMLTAQFPSTTAAHVTTIHSGLPVGESGVWEWFYYDPVVDDVIAPLLYGYAGEHNKRETLVANPRANPLRMFPNSQSLGRPLLYDRLTQGGVQSYVHQPADYAGSTYTRTVCAGAQLVPYGNLRHACENIVKLLKSGGPEYHFLYIDTIDIAIHKNGPISPVVDSAVRDVFSLLEEQLVSQIGGRAGQTLLMATADHGQVEVDPERTYYLNWKMPSLEGRLRKNEAGKTIRFGGSARDLFLYVQPGEVDSLAHELHDRFLGRAEVFKVSDMISRGLFGTVPPNSPLLPRVGDIAILPYRDQAVYWREGKIDMHFKGHHGGLTREEMEIPLLAMVV